MCSSLRLRSKWFCYFRRFLSKSYSPRLYFIRQGNPKFDGEASSRAQKLNTTITSAHKFFVSNHRIFIKAEENKVLGFIKVGSKKLFLRDRNFNYHEVNSLCVLDFYVHESTQRRGIGKQLFDFMLKFEKNSH